MSPARFWLGMAQMGMSTTAVVLLLMTGISAATITLALLATSCTVLSRRLYRDSRDDT